MNRSTIINRRQRSRGSAALEALFLVVILVVPIWVLLFNMGYAGARLRDTQQAARLSAYEVLKRRTAGDDLAGAEAGVAASVGNRVFTGEADPLKISVNEGNFANEAAEANANALNYLSDMMASLSGNTTVVATVSRESPFGEFGNTEVTVPLTTGGTPLTYCEMDNKSFNLFKAEGIGAVGLGILGKISGATSYILSPFGGLPTGDDKC